MSKKSDDRQNIELFHTYHELSAGLIHAKSRMDVKRVQQLYWQRMNCLLLYTLRRGLFSTNVAMMEFEAMAKGAPSFGNVGA